MSGTASRRTPAPEPRTKKQESFVDKLAGTLTRKKKPTSEDAAPNENAVDDDEVLELELEGREALDSSLVPTLSKNIYLEEGEQRRYLTKETAKDGKLAQVVDLLIYWLNEELADQRIVVRHLQEDLYDGQIIQKAAGKKLAQIRIEVPEVSQSEEGQRQKLQIVIATANRVLGQPHEHAKWSANEIHQKDIIAILQLLVAIALHFRAPVRFPDNVSASVVIARKEQNHIKTQRVVEQITTTQTELAPKGERDAFDTLFDYGPDKLAHVKTSLLAFCNKHLNKINLEVTDLDSQFQDGVFLVLLVGLLEGYFVPLYHFHLQVRSHEEKLKNVNFAFKLMEEAGLAKPRSRVQDIANGDLKSTLRLLHLLFTKYKHVERWNIVKKLGEGGFGAVYLVSDSTGKYALKVEGINEQVQVLKMEVFVLSELTKRGSRHFCKIEDKGRYGTFNYVVMTLVGKSLQDLRKATPQQHLSLACSLSVGLQSLEALEDLHNIGYLHRDVKPGNYTIGRAELNELRKVYILDFGMCRKFTNEQGVIRKPRQAAGFRGTVRYAPIACHLQRELCRKDDIETWIYMQVELTMGRLPWKDVQDMNQVGEFKRRVRNNPNELFPPPCPQNELKEILTIVDAYKYYDSPNYEQLYGLMKRAIQNCGKPEFPYDWEAGGPLAYMVA
ncbi:unnamed protein product [Caenorhabditis auriculariae]|uniref:Protein kinase domain-containing protein n=1 Tax=Caenorhabditis auriculariae TaxID=2777116 RepID=A0A8S1H6S5_9PELO|nr:unnamed protein product [Caenorhabditis auriculariae]